jgi:DNA-binding transcriptional regulator YiaG
MEANTDRALTEVLDLIEEEVRCRDEDVRRRVGDRRPSPLFLLRSSRSRHLERQRNRIGIALSQQYRPASEVETENGTPETRPCYSYAVTTRELLLLTQSRKAIESGAAEKLRREAHLSQSEVARAIGVAPSTVSRWEAGERMPKGRAARRYASLLADLERSLSSNGREAA